MEQQASTLAVKTVYTAGYEGESIDTFFEKLLEAGIQRLLDVLQPSLNLLPHLRVASRKLVRN